MRLRRVRIIDGGVSRAQWSPAEQSKFCRGFQCPSFPIRSFYFCWLLAPVGDTQLVAWALSPAFALNQAAQRRGRMRSEILRQWINNSFQSFTTRVKGSRNMEPGSRLSPSTSYPLKYFQRNVSLKCWWLSCIKLLVIKNLLKCSLLN